MIYYNQGLDQVYTHASKLAFSHRVGLSIFDRGLISLLSSCGSDKLLNNFRNTALAASASIPNMAKIHGEKV